MTNYYISPSGNDNNSGQIGAPFKTIQKAADVVNPGNTVIVRDGIYTTTDFWWWTRSGSPGYPITIKNFPGESPFLTSTQGAILPFKASWITVDGLRFGNTDTDGVHMEDIGNPGHHDITVRNCYFSHMTNSPTGAVFLGKYTYNLLVENNRFEDIGYKDLESIHGGSHSVYADSGSHEIIIRNNLFINSSDGPSVQGRDCYNIDIYNNVDWHDKYGERWFAWVAATGHVNIYNNTYYVDATNMTNLDWCKGIDVTYTYPNTVVKIKNNILYSVNNLGNMYKSSQYGNIADIDYNLYYPSRDSDDVGVHSFSADPLFVSTLNRNFHLQSSSPAIGKGLQLSAIQYDFDGNLRTGRNDIGAFQYTGTPTPICPELLNTLTISKL